MANSIPEGPSQNTRAVRGGLVIRQTALASYGYSGERLIILISAVILSVLVHGALLGVLVFVPSSRAEEPQKEMALIETKVEDSSKNVDLENDEVGIDPDLPTNYNNDRIESVSVPGPTDKSEAVGIPGAPDGPPVTLPPPPGFGGNVGHGAGIESTIFGKGSTLGLPGGLGGPKMIPGGFGGRSGSTREQMVRQGGGNGRSEAAVAAGLKWLSWHEAPDGHWSLDRFQQYPHCNCTGRGIGNDIAATAFGLLPFLGAGQTHRGGGDKGSIYSKNVEKALRYLISKQNREGDFGGGMYAHGLATIAMCEAYGLTSDPQLKGPAQQGLNFIAKAQSPQGGWSYTAPCSGHDTSVGGWQLMAIKSGQMAGLEVPSKTISGASRWLDEVSSPNGGTYGYTTAAADNDPGRITTTAVGLLCREYLGWRPRNPGLIKGADFLKKNPPSPNFKNMYYYYYATQVLHHMGGENWESWNPKMRDLLIDTQDKGTNPKHAHQRGSWDPKGDAWGAQGGRIMITSMAVLTLEVYYRHLPLYRRDMGGGK